MTRVALYARYSSDNQSVSSIEDQFRICREQAAREKFKVVGAYKDAAISGASVTLRPGIQALLQDAQAGKSLPLSQRACSAEPEMEERLTWLSRRLSREAIMGTTHYPPRPDDVRHRDQHRQQTNPMFCRRYSNPAFGGRHLCVRTPSDH